jgi:hypothetical protein
MNHLWVLYDPTKETQSEKLTTEEAQFILLRLKTKLINDFLIWREDWPKWKKLNAYLESEDSPFMSMISSGTPDSSTDKKNEKSPVAMSPAKVETVEKVRASFEFSDVQIKEIGMNEVFRQNNNQQFDGDQFSAEQSSAEGHQTAAASNKGTNLDFKSLNKNTAFGKRSSDDKYKIELLLIHPKGGMFRTSAKDISLTGTFCEKIIPAEFHTGTFDVIIINNFISDDDYKRLTLKGSIVVTDARTYIKYVSPTEEQKNKLRAGLDYYVRSLKKMTST